MWKKLLLINASMLVGFFAALFVIPGRTPMFVFAVGCLVVAATINVALFGRRREVPSGNRRRWRLLPVLLVWIVFVLALLLHIYHWPVAF
jgi:hypothetical protein